MAPGYKPLAAQTPTGLTALSFQTQLDDWDKLSQQNAAIIAQRLTNDSNEINLAEKQRIVDEQAQLREALRNAYEPQPGMEGEETPFNADKGLEIAQRLAMEQGDWRTAVDIERVTKERGQAKPISPALREYFDPNYVGPIPEGATPQDIITKATLDRARTYAQQVTDPRLQRSRELSADLAEQRLTGTQIRPPTAAQAAKIGAADAFIGQMDQMEERYVPYISENRGERFLAAAANPNSAAARLRGELNLAAKQAALALEDRVTDQDFKTIQEIASINELDTMETVLDRMSQLKSFIRRRAIADLNAAEGAQFNVDKLRQQSQFLVPQGGAPSNPNFIGDVEAPARTRLPRNPDGKPLTREQFYKTLGQ